MKHSLTIFLIISFIFLQSFLQIEKIQTPDYYFELIETIKLKKISLIINYVTIDQNIQVNDSIDSTRKKPTLEEYISFARSTPSYRFYVIKKSDTLFTISYLQKNIGSNTSFYYKVFDTRKKKTEIIKSNVWGEITEKRVDEMIFKKYDSESIKGAIVGTNPRQFLFNKMIYGYQDYKKLKHEITELTLNLIK